MIQQLLADPKLMNVIGINDNFQLDDPKVMRSL